MDTVSSPVGVGVAPKEQEEEGRRTLSINRAFVLSGGVDSLAKIFIHEIKILFWNKLARNIRWWTSPFEELLPPRTTNIFLNNSHAT